MVEKLSALVITYNEEANIGRCLEALVGLADEIVVVDSLSADNTVAIARSYSGVRVISQAFLGYGPQKNFAAAQASHEIVLSVDADEVVSQELAQSIRGVLADFNADGYTMNRLNRYCGRWVRHSGWYPDRKLRLWRKSKGGWNDGLHESVQMQPCTKTAHLRGDLLHYSYASLAAHVAQINKFTTIAASEAFAKGRKPNVFADIVVNPFLTFLKKYFIKLGFLDGYAGFLIAIHTSYGKFVKYIKLKELWDRHDKADV